MGKELNIKHSPVFSRNFTELRKEKRFIINQGGSRSSKTWSILQMLIVWGMTTPKKRVSIVRKTFPTLRQSVMKDFFDMLKDMDIYDTKKHHKTTHTYTFPNGTEIEFFSVDDQQKLRGRKRDILYANEANDLSYEEFLQLNMRTTEKLIFDFNPSDDTHWLYDLVLRDETVLIKSTYLDNPFLSGAQIKEIENLIRVDENYYKIYALGERPISKTRIYTHFGFWKGEEGFDDWCWGLDFGFNAPTALVKVGWKDGTYYAEELLYQTNLTSSDIVRRLQEVGVDKNKPIWADGARPEIIQEMRRAGFNVKAAVKDVKPGIDTLKKNIILLNEKSTNLINEYKNYNWKTKTEADGSLTILDEPVKLNDHLLDALRYAIHSNNKKAFNNKAATIFQPRIKPTDDW